jgi:tetratricopeptide (TPR) repeat protein
LLQRPKEPYRDPFDGKSHYLFTTFDGNETITPAMMIVEHILQNNEWERPIYFSGNPGGKSRYRLENRTRIVGSVFQVGREEANFDFDYKATAALLDSVFLLRSYNDPTIGLDDNASGLSMVYPEKELAIADYYRQDGDTVNAEAWLQKAVATFPFYWRVHEQYARALRAAGDSVAADAALQKGADTIGAYVREMPDNRMYWYYWGRMCDAAGRADEAEKYLTKAFYLNPYDQQTYQSLLSFLVKQENTGEAIRAARKWLEYYPDDSQARALSNLASAPSEP